MAVTLVIVIALGWVSVYRAAYSADHRSDFTVYTAAGRAVLAGADLYKAKNPRGLSYVYPPPFAILMVPFSVLPVTLGTLLWYALSVVLALWSLRMCVRMVREERGLQEAVFWPAVVGAVLVLPWLVQGIVEGQASVVLAWLVVAALYWQRSGRPGLGATCLAGAILVKVLPLVLLAYFAWRKRWRFVAATLVMMVILGFCIPILVFGPRSTAAYWREWVSLVATPSLGSDQDRRESPVDGQLLSPYKARSQTLTAVCCRLVGSDHGRELANSVAVVMLVIIGLVGWRSRPESELLVISAILVWMLLAAPLSEFHYLLVLLLPMMALVFVAAYEAGAVTRWGARATLVAFAAAGLLTLAFVPLQQIGLLCWAMIGLWGVLLAVVVRQARMSRSQSLGV
ncbi:MAG TPA: glycosyltransferase family 87 protein [Verrucomicrobiae bacterium]|nr:glycosyltransferase family 87 protein [Verrucomicrobiae bacterium]